MIRKLQHIICLLLLAGYSGASFSQGVTLKTSIDKEQILIGEPIQYKVEAVMPLGLDPLWLEVDSIPHFEVTEPPRTDTVRKISVKSYTRILTLTSFDSGRWMIPSMPLEIDGKTYMTDSLAVTVSFASFDPSQEYHDIKDIIDVQNPYTRYITWAVAGLTILALIGLIYFLRRRDKVTRTIPDRPVSRLTPLEEAIRALQELQHQDLAARGEVKQYYTRLNDILRWFLLRKLDIPTLERTNDELVLQVRQLGMHNDTFIPLAQALRMSDAVKFAKYNPDRESNEENFRIVKNSIELINDLEK